MKTLSGITAVCFDHRTLLEGLITTVTREGCEILVDESSGAPAFPKKTDITVNFLEESTGQSINVLVRLAGVYRKNQNWCYRVRWRKLPEILKAHLISDETENLSATG